MLRNTCRFDDVVEFCRPLLGTLVRNDLDNGLREWLGPSGDNLLNFPDGHHEVLPGGG